MEFRVLGPLEARSGSDVVLIGGPRQRKALAALVVSVNHTVSPERLASVMWDGAPPSTAEAQVQNCLSGLRRCLTAAGLPTGSLERGPGGYRLMTGDLDVDQARFDDHLTNAKRRKAVGDSEEALSELCAGLELWRGQALAGVDSLALAPAARRLEEMRSSAREDVARLRILLGDHDLAAAELGVLCEERPLHEGLYRLRMLALHGAGRPGEALKVFRIAREVFRRELGLDPGQELRELERVVLNGDRPPGLTLLSRVPLDDRETESPGPDGPDRLGEEGSPAPTSSMAWTWSVPSLLPPDISDFTGRRAQIKELLSLLVDRPTSGEPSTAVAIAGIVGMGGIGKTALAVHVAHQMAASYPDGQLYVNLQGAQASPLRAADVLTRFLRSSGLDSRAIPHDADERSDCYRSRLSGRRVLIVLDNAASEAQVRPLLPGAPNCAVLITSRMRLTGIEGADWIEQDFFSPAEAIELLARVADRERTFKERAEADEIVRLCGLLPLAVRIAAARLTARPMWRLADLAAMLRDEWRRLDQLTTGDLEVRASLALSYRSLDDEARRLFRLLGLFDGPDFPGWWAAAVMQAATEDATACLEALVDARLVTCAESDLAEQRRYRLHDLVRLYARERAEIEDSHDERASAHGRGFGAWLAVAERMSVRIPGPCYAAIHGSAPRPPIEFGRDETLLRIDPLLWFDAERAALLAVVHQACALNLHELAFDLAGCLEKYFDVRGMHVDWGHTNEQVLVACRSAGNLRGQAVMLRGLIDVRTWNTSDQTDDAMTRLHADAVQLLEMFTELGDVSGMADAAVLCSWGLTASGDYVAAGEMAMRSLHYARKAGHLGGQARAQVALALARGQQAQIEAAIAHLTEALGAARSLGNTRYEATVLQFLGMAELEVGDLAASRRNLDESLVISRTYDDRYVEALTLLTLARLDQRGDLTQARASALTSLALGRELNMPHHVADALGILGEIDLAEGHLDQAAEHLEASVRLWRTRGWPSFLARALTSLGDAYAAAGQPGAGPAWGEAQELFERLGDATRARALGHRLTQERPFRPES